MKEKIKVDELTIDGTVYVPKESVIQQEFTGDMKIVILQRGWIYVGIVEKNGDDCVIRNAYNIRRWGTTKGLGELSINGPTDNTILDKCYGNVEYNDLTKVNAITVNKEKWEKILL